VNEECRIRAFSTPEAGSVEEVELFDLILAVVALIAFGLAILGTSVVTEGTPMDGLISYFDLVICLMFLTDFARQLLRSERPWHYLRTWGWFDLVSSIPIVVFTGLPGPDWLGGAARGLRIVRLVRVLRAVRSVRLLYTIGRRDPAVAMFAALVLAGIVTFTGCCMGVLWAESRPTAGEAVTDDGRLDSAEEVLWWAVVTSSTVGYGDYAPSTAAGRAFAVGLMLVGIGSFATLTSAFGVLVGRVRSRGHDPMLELITRMDRLESALERVESELRQRSDRERP
jgi:voltage-gated potassium channel